MRQKVPAGRNHAPSALANRDAIPVSAKCCEGGSYRGCAAADPLKLAIWDSFNSFAALPRLRSRGPIEASGLFH